MQDEHQTSSPIEHAAERCEIIAGLERALDLSYRCLIRAARAEWDSRFAGKEPSDACVTVRITERETNERQVRGSGFLDKPKTGGASSGRKLPLPRFAR